MSILEAVGLGHVIFYCAVGIVFIARSILSSIKGGKFFNPFIKETN